MKQRFSRPAADVVHALLTGENLQPDEAMQLAREESTAGLMTAANRLRSEYHDNTFYTCGIINAKCGGCSEDCCFCGQSRHTQGNGGEGYDFIDIEEAHRTAAALDLAGIARLSLVASGRSASAQTMSRLNALYHSLREKYGFRLCGSLGLLGSKALQQLRRMGVERYHCNLEASPSYFPTICSSHTLADKHRTLHKAREQGLDLCSGGIIGLGESMPQRIELAQELRRLAISSVPINIMTPLPATPLAQQPILSLEEVLRSIAMFRLMLPRAILRMAGGRQQLGASQYLCFQAGANGAIVGNYLTTTGNPLAEDLAAIRSLGYQLETRAGENTGGTRR
ncbi:MAG: biotin synthase BioB [Desulfobulbaceae bacterium A2]|nr:MAG: biotin synthase BioB [Desulfobulbaceae bacterium A2]